MNKDKPIVIRLAVALTIALLASSALAQSSVEVWLTSADTCNSCDIYAEVAKRRQYGDTLRYVRGGKELAIPVLRVKKVDLSPTLLDQLRGDAGPSGPYWPVQLTVIVVQDGKVLHFGNIADSADISQSRYSNEQMFPPGEPGKEHPSFHMEGVYRRFFVENWNLEYFVAVALKDRRANASTRSVAFDHKNPVALDPRNLVLWAAAEMPLRNTIFSARRLSEMRSLILGAADNPAVRVISLYGHGPQVAGNDTSVMSAGSIRFERANVPANFGADSQGVNSVLTAIRRSHDTRTLLVHLGHATPAGIPLWGQLDMVTPEDLRRLGGMDSNKLVMVSGGCYSGTFATAVQCGFFAAHPQVLSTGCQLSPEALDHSDDYLRLFIAALSPEKTMEVDRNMDGETGFGEAHWYASAHVEDHQLTYTKMDALTDAYFADSAVLPTQMSLSEIRVLVATHASPEEAYAFESMTAGLSSGMSIQLTDLVRRNHAAQKSLEHANEATSLDRNKVIALPYKLMLPMLARRLIYKASRGAAEETRIAGRCESRTLQDFFAQ